MEVPTTTPSFLLRKPLIHNNFLNLSPSSLSLSHTHTQYLYAIGPISAPEDAEYVLQRTRNVHGFYGASSAERLPTEVAITQQMQRFKAIRY